MERRTEIVGYVVWVLLAAAATLAVAWLAFRVAKSGLQFAIVNSVIVGAVHGAILAALAWLAGVRHRWAVPILCGLFALAMVLWIHYFDFRDNRMLIGDGQARLFAESNEAGVRNHFGLFLENKVKRIGWLWLISDGLLVAAVSTTVAAVAMQRSSDRTMPGGANGTEPSPPTDQKTT